MNRALYPLLLALAACPELGCGGAPDIVVRDTCTDAVGTRIVVEQGATIACPTFASAVDTYQAEYQYRWGPLDLSGWTIRIRTGVDLDGDVTAPAYPVRTATTYHGDHIIDIVAPSLVALPHEFRHVELGPGSGDHAGWCDAFWPWERDVLGRGKDEAAYLGCVYATIPEVH